MDYESMNLAKMERKGKLRIIFMGTPQFSVPILEGLIENFGVRMVVTQPNRLKKNGEFVDTPVKEEADKNFILVLQPENINEIIPDIIELDPDMIVTCAYGQVLPKEIIDYPRYGCINVHASLLPKLRGGAPIHRAIMKGYEKTGITIMKMAEGLDTGDIITSQEIAINKNDTASSLHLKLSLLGKSLLVETIPKIVDKKVEYHEQNHSEATYAFNIRKSDEKIDFNKTAKRIYDKIRGLSKWPGAYCLLDGKRLKVYESRLSEQFYEQAFIGQITNIYEDGFGVKTGNREIIFTKVQPEGKKIMDANDYINGLQNKEKMIGKILR